MASISLSKVWSLILEEFKPVLPSISLSSANAEDSSSCSCLLGKLPIVCSSRKSGEDKYRVLAINGSNNKPRKANSCPLGITTVLDVTLSPATACRCLCNSGVMLKTSAKGVNGSRLLRDLCIIGVEKRIDTIWYTKKGNQVYIARNTQFGDEVILRNSDIE
uniref:Uncharacterized protein n=1 Tax=Glossina austeni TaxID=7395 RepID=A0A1A9VWP0_GLOAU